MRKLRVMMVLGAMFWASSGQAADDAQAELPESIRGLVCYDKDGRLVKLKASTKLTDVAQTVKLDGIPYIFVNPNRFKQLPPKLQIFFFEHECAHHLLGHLQDSNLWSESEADCLAIKMGRDRGVLSRTDILTHRMHIGPLQGSQRGHLPGPRRFGFLIRCFDDGIDGVNVSARVRAALDAASRFRQFARGRHQRR